MSTLEEAKAGPTRTPERVTSGGVGGWWGNTRSFITEVRSEMRRVTWPTRREVWATTVVVILVSTLFGIYLYTIDIILSSANKWLFDRFGA